MNLSEKDFLEICKNAIEKKMSWVDGFTPKQRDFEFLLDLIEEKSKIKLSLSTIKRIWEKESKTIPQISTLNALALFLDFSDWNSFKKEQILKKPISKLSNFKTRKNKLIIFTSILIITVFSAFSIIYFIFFTENKFIDNIEIDIISPTHKNFPQNIILKYEIKDTSLTDYFIKPYYNPAYTIQLDETKNQIEIPYAYPGAYCINLICESNIIEKYKVKISTNGWISAIFNKANNQYFEQNELIENGELVIKNFFLNEKKEKLDSLFFSGFYLVDKLQNVDGDNFIFEASIKCLQKPIRLPYNINIGFRHENFNSSFPLINMFNKYEAECKFGNTVFTNKNDILSSLVCDIYEWQKVRFEVKNRKFKIFVNNQLKFQDIYFENAGKLEGFCFVFPGLGAVDNIKIYNSESSIVYQNDFETNTPN